MSEISLYVLMVAILSSALRMSTPYLLASMGELFAEKSGVLNLSVEGMMTAGAFFSFSVTYFTGNPWLGVSVGLLAGCLAALIFCVLTISLGTNQIVTGIAMNLLTMGLTTYLFRVIFGISKTDAPFAKNAFVPLNIPVLSDIPLLGEVFFSQYLLVYIALLLVPVLSVVMHRTTLGLSTVALGENPTAADTRGIGVSYVRYVNTIFGGGMAGLAGSFLVIATMNEFAPDVVSGRGWIAIVLVIFAKWMPRGVLWGSLLFGFVEAIGLQFQVLPVLNRIPYHFFLMLPHLSAIAVLFSVRNLRYGSMPTYLSVPYKGGLR